MDYGRKIFQAGIREVIITDISKDGTLEGINRKIIKDFIQSTGLNVYIAGGVSKIEDIVYLKELESLGVKDVYKRQIILRLMKPSLFKHHTFFIEIKAYYNPVS